MYFQPFHDYVLIRRTEEAPAATGLAVPDSAKEKPQEGDVVAQGPDAEMAVVGQHVYFAKFTGKPITFDGVDYVIMHETELLGGVGLTSQQ